MSAIQVSGLHKSYDRLKAVVDFSFAAERGELVTLAGPDGAGKTTIFRAVCNLIDYEAGEIRILDRNLKKHFNRIKPLMGYMPQAFSLYSDLSVEENLAFYAGLFGIDRKELSRRKERLYEFSGLAPFQKRRAAALSGGMKQKLALCCNLIHDPEILLLDEPTTGVDPLSRRQFWDILRSLRESGSSVVVSTPYMDEVAMADRTVFIFEGRKLIEGTPDEVTAHFSGHVYHVDWLADSHQMEKLDKIEGMISRRFGTSLHLYTEPDKPIRGFLPELEPIGIGPDMIKEIEPDLEDTFIQLMGAQDANGRND